MNERILFTSSNLTVTDARLIYKGRSYPATAVKSFKTVEILAGQIDPKRNRNAAWILQGFAILLVVLGIYMTAIGQSDFLTSVGSIGGGVAFFSFARYLGKAKVRGDHALIAVQLTSGEQVLLDLDAGDAKSLDAALASIVAPVGAQLHATTSIADELAKLEALKASGILSAEDWERAKEAYLGKAPDLRENAVEGLRSLHGLYRDGVLSESEFNIKKWEILSKQA